MGIGRIASFLNSLSPAAEAASAAASADQLPPDSERRADAASAQSDLNDDNRRASTANDLAVQLQTMVGAVRTLNENAIQQGAAVAVSSAGSELRNAVVGLGHLLAAVDAQALAQGAAAPAREAAGVIDGVEAGLAGSQAAAEQVMRNLPTAQAQRAQEISRRFQADMRDAVGQVRAVLGSLKLGD